MKAEEPGDRVPVVKYGMGISEQHRLVERHFTVMEDEQFFKLLHFAQALHRGPALRAALDKLEAR